MKKLLFILMVVVVPFLVMSQPMNVVTIFSENFDGTTSQFSTSTNSTLGGSLGDWRVVGAGTTYPNWDTLQLYKSAPNCFHSPVYNATATAQATTSAIPLSSPGVDVNYVYLDFDHICKVNLLDRATIYISTSSGVDEDGNYMWTPWTHLSFSNSSDYYYGEASNPTGTAIVGGSFSDQTYSNWYSNSMTIKPNNNWWHHEMFDVTSFVFASGNTPTHFRLQFRVNKTSPPTAGTQDCAGWYLDNVEVRLSNCELIRPAITMQPPFYYNTNNSFINNVGPYTIKARLTDNDTINESSVVCWYSINSGDTVHAPNIFTSNVLNANGHTIQAQWVLPSICYQDTIYYHIYMEDVHGSPARFDTFLVAHHNYPSIHDNDVRVDTVSPMPHCLITGQPQPITVYFTNRSDALHSPGSAYMTSASFTMVVRDENGNETHNSTHNWTGDICFDIPDSLSLGTFTPTHGYNYVTVYVTTRNGQTDGFHGNDTIKISPYSCDSLMRGDYTIGGSNPDFANLEAAKTSLQYCGLGGPVTFHLRPGTYSGFTFDENYIGQSEVNTITFQGDDVNTVVLTNNSTDVGANVFGAVTLVNVKNYTFKNLTIQGNNLATASRGVVVRGNGSTNILFDGCRITAHNTHSTAATSAAVVRSAAAATYPDTIVFRNCTIEGGNFGIHYVGSAARRNNITVDNCDIASCYRGIFANYYVGTISHNHIKQVASTNPQNFTAIHANYLYGGAIDGNNIDSILKMEYGIYLTNATTGNFSISNNHLRAGNGSAGIYVNSSSSTASITGSIYNNEVILYPVTANNSYAVQINNSNNLHLINNSFIAKSDAPYSNTAALYISNGNNNTNIYNNILLNQVVNTDNTDYPLYLNGNATATGSFNDLNSGSGVVAYKTVPRNTIAELASAVTTLTDMISYLPPMVNSSQSLLPTNFSGLECWRNASVMTDIRGINRSEVTYMGAYADMIPSTDAAITALVSPALGVCPQNTYDIVVEITNKGSQTINFANNPAVITLQSTALNLNQTFNVNAGTVAALATINQQLSQNVPVPVNSPVDFLITITTNGDNNHLNDTLVQTFIMEAIIPDYEEDFSNGTQQTWTIEQVSGAGNWTFQNGTGANPTITPVYGTGRLFFNSKNFAANTTSRAIMPPVSLTNAFNPILEIWFAHDNANSANNKQDELYVKVSTDGGQTYTNMTAQGQSQAVIKRYKQSATTPVWELYTFDLSNYVSNGCVYIAFEAVSKTGNNMNVDRIRVRNLYDNDVAVSKIYGVGETPTEYGMREVVSAMVKNEGALPQNNVKVYLNVVGATEQWHDSVTVSTLPYNAETMVTFPDHQYSVAEVKDVEVRAANDQFNGNNAMHWRMVTTSNAATIADTTSDIVFLGDYANIIRPCVRYKTNEELAVTAVKYYYDQTYIADPENGFKAFVADASGTILATSEVVDFSTLQQGAWNIIPIQNFALTNTTGEFYVGLEMLAHGNYLCAQVETPLRDSTFYYLVNGTYEPQQTGRFMLGALVDTPYVHDVALLSLVHPVSNCDLGHEHLNLQLTNNGTTDIVPPIQLHYTINGGAEVTENFNDTLRSHETVVFTFNSIYDFTNNQIDIDDNYAIKIWATKLNQDRLAFNDTLGVTVVSRGKSAMPIVTDTVIVNYHNTTTLTAQLPASIPQGVLGWFTNSGFETWNLLSYSPTYTTPIIYFDTVYYVNANPGTVDDVIVGTGTGSGTDPMTFSNGYSRGRMLYLEQEVGHGTITAFALNVKTAHSSSVTEGIPLKIYMKTTDANVYGSTAVNWDDELTGATLVLDERVIFDHTGWFYFNLQTPFEFNNGNLEVYMETNCADYCTGSGNQCNNCGQNVVGANSYPQFYQTNTAGGTLCQKKSGNTAAAMNGVYTNVSKRLNARFTVANLDCGSEKVPIYIHVPDIPDYDVETQELLYPESSCALYDEHIQVQVKNMLNTPIPANKVVIHAVFNGTEVTHTVDEPFASEEVKIVEFTTPFDFSAPTANITFNYTIYTTLNNEATVYTGNDTITGQFVSTRTAYLPDSIVYTGSFTQPYTILQPADRPSDITQYYFYAHEADDTPLHTTTTAQQYYTTPALYDTMVYWMSGKTQVSNCVTKRIKVIVNVFRPQYDFSTDELLYPVSYQCASTLSPNLKVTVTNQDTTSNTQIPAGTFNLNAQFTGSGNVNGTHLISTPVSSLVQDTVTFANGINLGSPTQNRIYQYVIYTTPVDASMPVYTANDTISGSMYFPALPVAPQPLTYTVPYGGTQTVTPGTSVMNHFYFYENQSDTQPVHEGGSFTTEPIFAPTTYYYSGRIESNGFNKEIVAGIASGAGAITNQTNAAPFTLSNGHSYAKILYNKTDLEGAGGRIDSIYLHVCAAEGNGVGIPMKFWLANTADATHIATGNSSVNWTTETANATLVYEGEIFLDQTGWVGFPVLGGFDYAGEGLYLYAEHNCGDASCVATYGMNPTPKFTNIQLGNGAKKMLTKAQNTALTTATNFSLSSYRPTTKFKMNYTCESPKSTITINTTVPQHDVGVVAITAPVEQNNNFSATEAVTVTLQNFGTQAASNFPVTYQLGSNAPVTQNYSGSLAAGATANMTFGTNCDMTSVYYAIPFKAYTDLNTDTYHANDTTTIYVRKEDPCVSGPLAVSTGAHITNVTFASLNNGTGAPYTNHPVEAGANGRYTDFTQTVPPVVVILGQEYQLSVTHAFSNATAKTVYKRAYIDYNRDGVFQNSEEVLATTAIPAGDTNATVTQPVNIPTIGNAEIGLTRMRVICSSTNQTSPCGYFNNNSTTAEGETEDYAVMLSSPMEIDLGIPAVLHPVGDICADDHANIRVNVRNYGTQTQVLSMDNPLTVTATVSGATTGTYSETVESGSLAPNGEMTVKIPNVNFSSAGVYHVDFQLTYAADQYMTNNTRSSSAEVTSTVVSQLPFVETFVPQGTDVANPQLPDSWELTQSHGNYYWREVTGASQNNNVGGGPAHDHTYAGTSMQNSGGYVSVNGVNGTTNRDKWTSLTSRCINLHYSDIYPAEFNFYKYFAGSSNADFNMSVQVGSGEYYQTVETLTKADGGQVGGDDVWKNHLVVLHSVDEVARLRFTVTNQVNKIDPSIDDINIVIGQPDMAINRIVYPLDKNVADACLEVNSVISPVIELYNNGNSAVEEFDVLFNVGVGNDIVTQTEHIVHHLAPGDTLVYTSTNEFVVTNLTSNWEVKATVVIENDKNEYNNTKRSLSCTNVGVDEYDGGVYLGQNEPNPAVTTTRIPYSVMEPGKVTLELTNSSGQLIYTDVQEALEGTNYFDLATANLAAGVYYYTIHYKDIVLTKKMVVEK